MYQPTLPAIGLHTPVLSGNVEKRMGRVFTPEPLANSLCRWAIRTSSDRVLDLGLGEGVFALTAYDRLKELGAGDDSAAASIYGAELDPAVFQRAQAAATRRLGRALPNVVCADFYEVEWPSVDAVIGNPPYVRRHYQADPATSQLASGAVGANGLTDTYCYFLYRACGALKQGGRLAVIVSASWLDMNYGQKLKRLLLDQFRLHLVLGFDGRVFSDAVVKPVVILAERGESDGPAAFGRLENVATLDGIDALLNDLAAGAEPRGASLTQVSRSSLRSVAAWSSFLKSPEVYAELTRSPHLVPLHTVADSRIGLQTFAKAFYIMTRAYAARLGLEPEYLLPLALSPRYVKTPVIARSEDTKHVVFACDRPMANLEGTAALRYITAAMEATVPVRGKDQTVRGFHRAPRLMRARRTPWYNVRSALAKRRVYEILLPRRVFETYLVVHNCAGVIGNEDFIELHPLGGEKAVRPLLTFLNSSFGEFLVRSHSFQYGGGVYNLNPGAVRHIPILDPLPLRDAGRIRLERAWESFAARYEYDAVSARDALDDAVAPVLQVTPQTLDRVKEALRLFVRLAPAASQAH